MLRTRTTVLAGLASIRTLGTSVLFLALALWLTAGAGRAQAVPFTGDPVADAWAHQGNSLSLGTFVNNKYDIVSHAPFDFDVYSESFEAGGATYAGIGAVLNDNYDLNKAQVKFGDSQATFAPSTYLPGSPGHELDLGDGISGVAFSGPGGFLVNYSTTSGWALSSSQPVFATEVENSSLVTTPVNTAAGEVILFMSTTNSSGGLRSFEFIINESTLRAGLGPILFGDKLIVTLQHVEAPCNFTNAFGTFQHAPEPATIALLAVGVAATLGRRRRGR